MVVMGMMAGLGWVEKGRGGTSTIMSMEMSVLSVVRIRARRGRVPMRMRRCQDTRRGEPGRRVCGTRDTINDKVRR